MSTLIWKPTVSRVIECILGTFDFKLINFLITMCYNNFDDLLNTREGYFILRILVKISKESQLQERLIEKINSNFEAIVTSRNGSLLCQCIIHNFPIPTYQFFKSCSNKSNPNNQTEVYKNYDNQALKSFIHQVVKYWKLWDDFHMGNILECAIKNSGDIFETECFKLLKKDKYYLSNALLSCESGVKIFNMIESEFTSNGLSIIVKSLKEQLKENPNRDWKFLKDIKIDKDIVNNKKADKSLYKDQNSSKPVSLEMRKKELSLENEYDLYMKKKPLINYPKDNESSNSREDDYDNMENSPGLKKIKKKKEKKNVKKKQKKQEEKSKLL